MGKKRSKYRPRPVMRDTMHWVKSGFYKVDGHPATADLKLANHIAMEALRKGEATRADIDALVNMLNMIEALKKVNPAFGEDYAEEIETAQGAMMFLIARCKERGVYTCTAVELNALRVALELHDAQLDIATVSDVASAAKLVAHIVGSGKAHRL